MIDAPRWLRLLGKTLSGVLATPGRLAQSVAESSFDAWVKYYRSDENTPNATISYYTKGSLVALALDLSLRADGGTLDQVMRRLWASAGGGAIDEADIARSLQQVAGRSMAAELAAWVHGTGDLPLQPLLARAGIAWHTDPADLAAQLGLRVSEAALSGIHVKSVFRGSAAEAAGVNAGDELLAVDGWRLRRLDDARHWTQPGQPFALTLVRDQRLRTLQVAAACGAARRRTAQARRQASADGPGAAPGVAGRVKTLPLRRRGAVLGLVVVVSLAHWWLAHQLPPARIGDGSAERMPKRIEVAFVRELAPAAPPAAPPVMSPAPVRTRPKAAAKPAPAASAASAASDEAVVAEALQDLPQLPVAQAAPPAPPLPEPVAQPLPEAVASAASAASAPAAFEWPPSTRLSYQLRGNYRGEVAGGAQVEWVRAGSRYQVHLDVWVGSQAAPLVGRRMSSDGELGEQGLTPRRYDEETRALFRELRRRTIVFEGDRVLLANGKQLQWQAGMQDAASQFVQLTWLFTTQPQLLKVGQRIELPLALPTNVDRWSYEVIEEVALATPFGLVQTFHLRPRRELRPNRELVADAWFAPTLQYLPVRLLIRQDESTYIDMMIDRLPQQEAAASAPR